jgi:hypothetical protein
MTFRLKAASGPHTGQTFDLSQDTAIGSADSADIRIDGLADAHARIRFDGQTLTLESSEESFVNGQLAPSRALKSGDEIRFGEHRFVLQAPGLRPPRVLQQARPRPAISPWTWVAVGVAAVSGFAGVAAFVLTRLG